MSGGHVLVIEDDEWVARLLAVGLREAGHRVTLCADGAGGITTIHREAPDCVVCDVELPDVDGYAIGRSMRQGDGRVAGTPLVYLCARDEDPDSKIEALRNGGDAFLSKPFRIDEVAATVTALIRLAERNRGIGAELENARISPAPAQPPSRPPPADAPDGVLEGDLAKVSVATILTVLEMEKHTGHLEMTTGVQTAKLHIVSGNVDGAQLGDTDAEPIVVLRTVLTWTGGRFMFVPTKKPERRMTGRATVSALLMEAARLDDEHRAGLPHREDRDSTLPPGSSRRGDGSRPSERARIAEARRSDARLSDALGLAFASTPPPPPSAPVSAPPSGHATPRADRTLDRATPAPATPRLAPPASGAGARAPRPPMSGATTPQPAATSTSSVDEGWLDDDEEAVSLSPISIEPPRRGPPPVPPPRPTTSPTPLDVEAARQKVLEAAQQAAGGAPLTPRTAGEK